MATGAPKGLSIGYSKDFLRVPGRPAAVPDFLLVAEQSRADRSVADSSSSGEMRCERAFDAVSGPGQIETMASSKATTVAAYLRELPADRRHAIEAVRNVVRKNLAAGFVETMNWGMISYEIPLATYSSTYNKKPLAFAALAAQKNYNALYLMSVYGANQKKLRDAFQQAGKELDIGKSCIRFKSAEDLPLDVIGEIVASVTPAEWIAVFEASRKSK